jgi:nuclear pore complex protein Nup210
MPEANGLPYRLVNVPIKDSPLSDCGGLCGDLDIQIKLEDDVSLLADLNVLDHCVITNNAYSILHPTFFHGPVLQGVFSDLFVVKGIEIGHEIVSVHLLEPQLQNMADEILLTVAEAMSLEPPSPVFVLVGAVVPYTLKVIRGNIPQGFLKLFNFLLH